VSPERKEILAQICILEDDPTIRDLVAKKLRSQGYEVDDFGTVESVKKMDASLRKWDLFIVDILLHGERAGLTFCGDVRKNSASTPILVLSALSEPADRIEGLRAGADDYLNKPFEMEELLLRVEGMLRRRSWYSEMPDEKTVYSWGNNSVDFEKMEGTSENKTFPLTVKECMIMKLLIHRRGQVVDRTEILDKVWGYDVYPSNRTVDNFILRLRIYIQ